MKAGEQLAESLGPDGEHRRQSDRAVHGIAAADPIPEAEHIVRVDAELAHGLTVGRDGDEMLRHSRVGAKPVEGPAPRRRGIGHGLERRERLR
jgi:hypothetical protein